MNKNKKLLLFDLDGVILNSKDNMMLSWHRVSERSKEIEDVYKEASIANLDKLSFFEGV